MKIRTLIGKISILTLVALALPFLNERSALADPLPGTFFSQNWNRTNQSDIPSVPFGGMRLWDTVTTWADIQYAGSNTYWYGVLDRWLAEAQAGNHDVLYTFGKVPTWDTNGVDFPKDFNNGNNAWKQFVTNLVQHSLASTTAHIKYYEIWNEPDLSGWGGTPAQLVTMAQQAYPIIHSLDSNALVVGPGWSSAGSFGDSTNGIIGYYAAGGAVYQDIVGYHLYLYGTNGQFPGNPQSAQGDIIKLKSIMASNGISSKPIWYTEGAWGNQTNTNVIAMTTDDRTAYLAQDYLFLWGEGVARFYWYSWDATNWGTLWTTNGGVNPTGLAYGQLYNWLVGSVPDSTNALVKGTGNNNTWTASLTLSTGDQAQIIWNATATNTITVPTNFTYYQTLDNDTLNVITSNSVTIGNKPILIVAPQPVSLALNRPVTVSSSSGSGLAGSNAVDGNFSTRWSSTYSDPQWIYVDLGAVTAIAGVTLIWEEAFASSYKIQVSTDATNWTDVYTNTNGAGGTERIKFSASGRYVKMLGIHRATSYGYSLWEFQVFGPNLALKQPVTVSSTSGPSFAGTNAVDGNFSTRWSSAYSDPQWISVDLGAVTPINEVSFTWQVAYASQYKIQVSADTTNWTDIYTNTAGIGGVERFVGPPTSGRYVRMLGTQRGTIWGYSLWEFQVFGL